MTLDLAIEILEDWVDRETIVDAEDFMKAQRLSIEALKAIVSSRLRPVPYNIAPLPGETED